MQSPPAPPAPQGQKQKQVKRQQGQQIQVQRQQTGQGQQTSEITAQQYELLKKIEEYLTDKEQFPKPTLQGVKNIIFTKQQITTSTKQGQQQQVPKNKQQLTTKQGQQRLQQQVPKNKQQITTKQGQQQK